MTTADRHDTWAVGSAYEGYVGRWSRLVADEFLGWIDVPAGRDWLDVGCGTGALTEQVLLRAAPARILGVDQSAGFVGHAGEYVADPRASFRVGDARALPVEENSVDAAVSGLVLNFVPEHPKVVAEMRRVTRPGGTVALYVWDYTQGMQMMRYFWDAAVALNPGESDLDEGPRFPICRPQALRDLFAATALHDIETRPIDVPTVFADFDDYWSPFLGGQGAAPAYCISRPEAERDVLRDRIRASLPIGADGRIRLTARAWGVKATA